MSKGVRFTARIGSYLCSPPAILATVSTRVALPTKHTTLAIALYGWGWLSVCPADREPRLRDWRFFVGPSAHVLVQAGREVRLVAKNLLGSSVVTYLPLPGIEPGHSLALASPVRISLLRQLKPAPRPWQLPVLNRRIHLCRFSGTTLPAVLTLAVQPVRMKYVENIHSRILGNRLTQCSQFAKNTAAAALAAARSNKKTS